MDAGASGCWSRARSQRRKAARTREPLARRRLRARLRRRVGGRRLAGRRSNRDSDDGRGASAAERTAERRRTRRRLPAKPEAGQVHRLGQRRPAHAPAAARPGARQRRRQRPTTSPPSSSRSATGSSGVDLGLCHLETPMGPGPPTSYPIFDAPPISPARSSAAAGTPARTASNHSIDGGQAGIDGTLDALDQCGARGTPGSFAASDGKSRKPTILNVGGVKVGFVAYTDATNGLPAPQPWSVNEYAVDDPEAGARAIIGGRRGRPRAPGRRR